MNVCLGMTERMSLDLWRVRKWNQNLIFQNLQKVKKTILNVCIHVFVLWAILFSDTETGIDFYRRL